MKEYSPSWGPAATSTPANTVGMRWAPCVWTWGLVAQFLDLRDGMAGPSMAIDRLFAAFPHSGPFNRDDSEHRFRERLVRAMYGAWK